MSSCASSGSKLPDCCSNGATNCGAHSSPFVTVFKSDGSRKANMTCGWGKGMAIKFVVLEKEEKWREETSHTKARTFTNSFWLAETNM